tara:strand:+ start:384 stop:542 length:159 start_codon:yes stop_codon:yes gene_type:complete
MRSLAELADGGGSWVVAAMATTDAVVTRLAELGAGLVVVAAHALPPTLLILL